MVAKARAEQTRRDQEEANDSVEQLARIVKGIVTPSASATVPTADGKGEIQITHHPDVAYAGNGKGVMALHIDPSAIAGMSDGDLQRSIETAVNQGLLTKEAGEAKGQDAPTPTATEAEKRAQFNREYQQGYQRGLEAMEAQAKLKGLTVDKERFAA